MVKRLCDVRTSCAKGRVSIGEESSERVCTIHACWLGELEDPSCAKAGGYSPTAQPRLRDPRPEQGILGLSPPLVKVVGAFPSCSSWPRVAQSRSSSREMPPITAQWYKG